MARLTGVATRQGIWVNTILRGVVTAFESAVRSVKRVQKVVERGAYAGVMSNESTFHREIRRTLRKVSSLVQCHGLRFTNEGHSVLQVQIRLAIDAKANLRRLNDTCAWSAYLSRVNNKS